MKRVNLKCGGFVDIEPFLDGEEQDRHKIYDENGIYLDYIPCEYDVDFEQARYDKQVEYFENCEDLTNWLNATYHRYDYAETLENLIYAITDNRVHEYMPEELQEEIDLCMKDLKEQGEWKFCQMYDVNKIGKYYFRGE